jgi:hypothetical protein
MYEWLKFTAICDEMPCLCDLTCEVHGVTSQKTVIFIAPAWVTSNAVYNQGLVIKSVHSCLHSEAVHMLSTACMFYCVLEHSSSIT